MFFIEFLTNLYVRLNPIIISCYRTLRNITGEPFANGKVLKFILTHYIIFLCLIFAYISAAVDLSDDRLFATLDRWMTTFNTTKISDYTLESPRLSDV